MTGFTLFRTRRGWQLSTRHDGEEGWSIRFVSDETAAEILAVIDRPWPTLPAEQRVASGLQGHPAKPSLEELGL